MILTLPTELKIKIIQYLLPYDLLTLSRSCKTLRTIVLNNLQCKECHQYKEEIALCHLMICFEHFICKDCLSDLLHSRAIKLPYPNNYLINVTVKNNMYHYGIINPYISEQLMHFYHDHDVLELDNDYDESYYADSDDEPYVYFVSRLLS